MKLKKIACTGTLVALATLGLASCGSETKTWAKFDSSSSEYDSQYSDSNIYSSVLGEFDALYSTAKSNMTNLNQRYADMALAEAKLLETGVFLPTSTQGGTYSLSKVAPRLISDAQWGNDYERFHNLLVADKAIKRADRDEAIAAWKIAKTAAASETEVFNNTAGEAWKTSLKALLTAKGYTFKKTYTTMYTSDPKTWDIFSTSRAADTEPVLGCYDGLVQYNALGQIVPALAESWEHNADYTEFKFTIRSGAEWTKQDGTKYADVTAQDFVTGFQHMLDAQGGLEYLVQGVVEGADEYIKGKVTFDQVGVSANGNVVTYKLCNSTPWFMTMLGYSIFAPMNKAFFLDKGGALGSDYDPTADSYKYGKEATDILSCGAFRVTNSTAKNKIEYTKNDKYWDAANVALDTVTWLYNDGEDTTLTYNNFKDGKIDACALNTSTIATATADGWDDYRYVSDTNATTYNAFLNVKRQAYKNTDGKVSTSKNQSQADITSQAMLNQDFRLALCLAVDRVTYNAQTTGTDVAAFSLRNTYTPGNFVKLSDAVTVSINGTSKTFPAGTEYGEIIQAQLTADGADIVAYKDGTTDGFDGWYNPTAAKAHLDKAVAALKEKGVTIDANNPVVVELPTFTGSQTYTAKSKSYQKSVESALGGLVKVVLTDCQTADDWYNAGYYTESGKEANYDVYDLSGWGPDYGDPSTYLDTMFTDGYMLKCIGIF